MKKDDISKSTMISRNQNIDAADLNGEKVMMSLEKGRYFALNEVGSRIWDIIDKPTSVEFITEILTGEYDIDVFTCEKALIEFLGRMKDAELICVS